MKIQEPKNIYLRFEKAVKTVLKDKDKRTIAQRVAVASLPYIALYQPAGQVLSIGSSGLRTISDGAELAAHLKSGQKKKAAVTALKTSITALSFFSSVYKNPVGLLITTGIDVAGDMKHLAAALRKGNKQEIFEALIHATTSSMYMATMIYGSLEVIVASMLLQSAISFYQSGKEFKKGRYIEGVSNLGMGAIRAYQAEPFARLLKRKWDLFSKFAAIKDRIEESQNIAPSKDHPLENVSEYADDHEVLIDNGSGEKISLGAYISRIGGAIVKGMCMCLRNRNIEGKEITEIEFKVNHVFREAMKQFMNEMGEVQANDFTEFLNFMGIPTEGVVIDMVPYEYLRKEGEEYTHEDSLKIGEAFRISIPGIGQILVGATEEVTSLYDRVLVQIEKGSEFEGARTLLALLGISGALKMSNEEEVERMKIGQLFRIFFPREATSFERTDTFFSLNLEALKDKILELAPGMKQHFEEDLDKMETVEVLPGLERFSLKSLGDLARSLGARALLAGVGNGGASFDDACNHLVSILFMGLLSSQKRFDSGMNIHGDTSVYDHITGGADSIFLRLLTDSLTDNPLNIDDIPLHGQIQLIISPEALNTGSYQYHLDNYGSRRMQTTKNPHKDYKKRHNILEFTKEENREYHKDNEVMIKDRVKPEHILGCIVPNQKAKDLLIEKLLKSGLVSTDETGTATINGIPLDQFIVISDKIDANLLEKI